MNFDSKIYKFSSFNGNFHNNQDVANNLLTLRRNIFCIPYTENHSIFSYAREHTGLLVNFPVTVRQGNVTTEGSSIGTFINGAYFKYFKDEDSFIDSDVKRERVKSRPEYSLLDFSRTSMDNAEVHYKMFVFNKEFVYDCDLDNSINVLKFNAFLAGTDNYLNSYSYNVFDKLSQNIEDLKEYFPELNEIIKKMIKVFNKSISYNNCDNTVTDLRKLYNFLSRDRFNFGIYKLLDAQFSKTLNTINEKTIREKNKEFGFEISEKISYKKFKSNGKKFPKLALDTIRWSEKLLDGRNVLETNSLFIKTFLTNRDLILKLRDKKTKNLISSYEISSYYKIVEDIEFEDWLLIDSINKKEEEFFSILVRMWKLTRDLFKLMDKKKSVVEFKKMVLNRKNYTKDTPLNNTLNSRGYAERNYLGKLEDLFNSRKDLFTFVSNSNITPISVTILSKTQQEMLNKATSKLGFNVSLELKDKMILEFNRPIVPTRVTLSHSKVTTLTVEEIDKITSLLPHYFPNRIILSDLDSNTPSFEFFKNDDRAMLLSYIHPNVSSNSLSICSGSSYENLEEKLYAIFNFSCPSGYKHNVDEFKRILRETGDDVLKTLSRRIGTKGKK